MSDEARRDELKKLAYVPDFHLADAPDDSDFSARERMAPAPWNADMLWEFSNDPNCPNSDYFLEAISQWILDIFSQQRGKFGLDSSSLIARRAGIEWAAFFPHHRPIAKKHAEDNFVDRTLDSMIDMLRDSVEAKNVMLDRMAKSKVPRIQSAYVTVVARLEERIGRL